jgi:hypothetical protein
MFISGASRAKTAEPHPKLDDAVYTAAKEIEEAGGNALPILGDNPRRHLGDRGVQGSHPSTNTLCDVAPSPRLLPTSTRMAPQRCSSYKRATAADTLGSRVHPGDGHQPRRRHPRAYERQQHSRRVPRRRLTFHSRLPHPSFVRAFVSEAVGPPKCPGAVHVCGAGRTVIRYVEGCPIVSSPCLASSIRSFRRR